MKPTPTYANKPTSDNPRDVEAWALAEAARRLIDAGRNPDNAEALRAALQLNQRLWTIFQAAMTEEDCGHPPEVRTNIAALSLLVDRETTARLIDLDGTKLETLVAINRSVASGLTMRAENAEVPAQPGQPAAPRPQAAAPGRPPMVPPAPAPDGPPAQRQSLSISI
ncbi:flagellar biosynthesis regulator FlaF [Azospirillum rugosum]|uniref:Flagellar protein FlaF n=1 Tax=Azospirillum rugosum TaxID=416170 RepID=A0ABS4SGE9_9PROT|nr:flagellar biosynthesis regulator FlaF [Azospirillum rugosum]MBP2291644.1 flagellar protein FlaF [Azospirillum rugosum]MDQ0524544.1 flagellar protein FlaF [Azospirillum rugosum]